MYAPELAHLARDLRTQLTRRTQHERLQLASPEVEAARRMGKANAAVLPLPVFDCPIRSRPASSAGILAVWIGVGRA